MAVGDRIFTCRSVKAPTSAIDGVRYAVVSKRRMGPTQDPGVPTAAGGPAERQAAGWRIEITVWGTNLNALNTLAGQATANCVIGYKGAAGALEKVTYKNVHFFDFVGDATFRDPDTGGVVNMSGVRGVAEWGVSDTLALMEVFASDA
jgi:hypothetical protein